MWQLFVCAVYFDLTLVAHIYNRDFRKTRYVKPPRVNLDLKVEIFEIVIMDEHTKHQEVEKINLTNQPTKLKSTTTSQS